MRDGSIHLETNERETAPAAYHRFGVAMDTIITLQVSRDPTIADPFAALDRAMAWFATVEQVCSRFDPASELSRLSAAWGLAVPVSELLFEAVAFAIEVARLSGGAFDPTIGLAQERRGFTGNYITRREMRHEALHTGGTPVSYRDVVLDRRRRTIILRRPLLLDLGAVAKGLAVDLAAKELAGFQRFAIDAGGDIYAGGSAGPGQPWRTGIRDPREPERLLGAVDLWNQAICTSGDYERRAATPSEHHLLDPRTARWPRGLGGVSVVAPSAMVADALATAAFVLGAQPGLRLLESQGVGGIIVTSTGTIHTTPDLKELF